MMKKEVTEREMIDFVKKLEKVGIKGVSQEYNYFGAEGANIQRLIHYIKFAEGAKPMPHVDNWLLNIKDVVDMLAETGFSEAVTLQDVCNRWLSLHEKAKELEKEMEQHLGVILDSIACYSEAKK